MDSVMRFFIGNQFKKANNSHYKMRTAILQYIFTRQFLEGVLRNRSFGFFKLQVLANTCEGVDFLVKLQATVLKYIFKMNSLTNTLREFWPQTDSAPSQTAIVKNIFLSEQLQWVLDTFQYLERNTKEITLHTC